MANKFLNKLDEILAAQKANSKKEIMTIDDVSSMLNMSNSYLYKLTSQKLIPHYKPLNKTILFKRSEIMKWIDNSRVPTDEELHQNYRRGKSL